MSDTRRRPCAPREVAAPREQARAGQAAGSVRGEPAGHPHYCWHLRLLEPHTLCLVHCCVCGLDFD